MRYRCTESNLFAELITYLFEALGRPNIALRGLAHTQVRRCFHWTEAGTDPYLSPSS
jgi:hypothetical protein